MIAELSELSVPAFTVDPATPPVLPAPLPRIDPPHVRSRWIGEDGRELTDLVDPPIAGLPVSLRDQHGIEIAHSTTDAAGKYRFADIPRGDYTVVFTAPSGVNGSGGSSGRIDAGDRRPVTYWPGDSVVPTPVHTWLPSLPAAGARCFTLEGTLS